MTDCDKKSDCGGGRREFLVKASALAGGLVLSLSGANVLADDKNKKGDGSGEAVLKLDAKSPLNKVGGSDTVKTDAGKVVVVRTGEMEFKAFTAKCPHEGGPIKYDDKTKQLYCSWHDSRFDTTGKVVKGPSKVDLQNFQTQEAIVVIIPQVK